MCQAVLSAGDTAVIKTDKIPAVPEAIILVATHFFRGLLAASDIPDVAETKLPQLRGHGSLWVFLQAPWICILLLPFLRQPLHASVPQSFQASRFLFTYALLGQCHLPTVG